MTNIYIYYIYIYNGLKKKYLKYKTKYLNAKKYIYNKSFTKWKNIIIVL